MSDSDRTPPVLTPASRVALAHYRAMATGARAEAAACSADAARWDALADELQAFGDQANHHEGQGALL
ncbi:MAG: hypothetical protein JJE50_13865 [Actinomycetales bacterium]|nr:hypothetical protein [Actinomycetales bacterium]